MVKKLKRVIDNGINRGPNKRGPLVHTASFHPRTGAYEALCLPQRHGCIITQGWQITTKPTTCKSCKEM